MSDNYESKINSLIAESKELEVASKKILPNKVEFTGASVVALMDEIKYGLHKFLELKLEEKNFDEEGAGIIKNAIDALTEVFSKFKIEIPDVNFSPTISVDLKPIQSIAKDIQDQNKSLIALIEKSNNGNKSDQLYDLITLLVNKQIVFLEQAAKATDYTGKITELVSAVNANQRPVVEKLIVDKDEFGIRSVTPIYFKQKVGNGK